MSPGPISSSLSSAYISRETFPLRELNFSLLVAIVLGFNSTEPAIPTEREYFSPQYLQKALLALLVLTGLAWVVCFPLSAVPLGRQEGYSLVGQGWFNKCSPLKLRVD